MTEATWTSLGYGYTSLWQFQKYRKNRIPILIFGSADISHADEKNFCPDKEGTDDPDEYVNGKTCCLHVPCAAPYDKSFCRNNYKARWVRQQYPLLGGTPRTGLAQMYGARVTLS